MPKPIRPSGPMGATRPQAGSAGSLRDGADLHPRASGGRVADALWEITPRRRPLLTLVKLCSRHGGEMKVNRP